MGPDSGNRDVMVKVDLQRFRLLAQATGDALCDWDIVTDRSWLNDRWQEMFGPVDAATFDTAAWYGMVHRDDRARIERELSAALAGDGGHWTGEYRFRRSDGGYAPILERACIVRDDAGRAIRLVAAMTDLSDHRLTAQTLRDTHRLLHEFTSHLDECYWVRDVTGRGVYINPVAERIWGIADEVLRTGPTTILRVVHPDDRDRVAEVLRRQLAGEETHSEYRILRGGDGALRWVQTRAFPIYDDEGRFYRYCGISRDVTAQKIEEARLRESEEHYRRLADSNRLLLAEVNHRVRNNLASLRSLIQLTLAEQMSSPEAFARALDHRVSAMAQVHSLLADAAWQDLDLRTLIESVGRAAVAAADRAASFRLDGPAVRVTPRQATPLAMTLMELIANSGKHGALSAPAGRVEIDWRLEDEALSLRWREVDGPPVEPPARSSVGTELIEGFIRYELGGQCDLRYPPTGVDHHLTIPLPPEADRGSHIPC